MVIWPLPLIRVACFATRNLLSLSGTTLLPKNSPQMQHVEAGVSFVFVFVKMISHLVFGV